MSGELDAYLDPPNPRSRVHSIAARIGISPDIADDYYKLTNVESGHNVNVRDSSKGAKGFGQVMPDTPGGSVRTVGGRKYNLRDPDQNITAGLSYFAEGGNDPVARRLYYFGGPRAKQHYEKTGKIPNISDGNMTAAQYVRATGARQSSTRVEKPKDDLDAYLDPPADPIVATRFATNAPAQSGSRKLVNRFAGLTGGADVLKRPVMSRADLEKPLYEAQRGERSINVNNIDPRILKGEQPADRLAYMREGDLQNRVPSEPYRDTVARQQKEVDWVTKNQPAIDRETRKYQQDIKRHGDPLKWISEFGTKAAAGLTEYGGLVSDSARIKATAAMKAAELEGADRSEISRLAQDLPAGFISSLPEVALMELGVPPVAAFGAGAGARAAGMGRDVPSAIGQGALSALPFEIPVPKSVTGRIARAATRAGTVGAGTTGIELAQGRPLTEAIRTGGSQALVAGLPELGRRGNAKTAETQPRMDTRTQREILRSDIQPAQRGTVERSVDESRGQSQANSPQRFYHKDWGEVVATDSQEGARKGRTRVVEVDNPEAIHYPRTADLRGRGNERMVPLKPEPKPETDIEQYLEPPTQPASEAQNQPLDTARTEGAVPDGVVPIESRKVDRAAIAAKEPLKISEEWGDAIGRGEYKSRIVARDKVGKKVGEVVVSYVENEPSKAFVHWVEVPEAMRRKGIATAMYDWIKSSDPEIKSIERFGGVATPEGAAFRNAYTGGKVKGLEPVGGLADIRARAKERGVELDAYENGDKISLPRIVVPKQRRGHGDGSAVMRDLTAYADATGKTITLSPSRDFGATSVDRLKTFYKQLGFVENKGRNKDFTISDSMYRAPKKTEQPSSSKVASPEIATAERSLPEIKVPESVNQKGEQLETPAEEPQTRPSADTSAERMGTSSPEPSTTAAKKASMSADRAELDLPELPVAERRGWQDTLDKAKDKGTQNASVLADEVLAKPRPLNDVETGQLVLRAQEVKNELAKVRKEIVDEPDIEVKQAKIAQSEALQREFNKLSSATKASGSEKGRTLAAQKLTINQDYDLTSMVQRAVEARGRDLTPKEHEVIARQSQQIEELTAKLAAAEEKVKSQQLQKEIDRVVRRDRRAETKAALDDEFAALKAQFAKARAEMPRVQASGLAGLDPEGVFTKLIGQMARNRVRAGSVTAEGLVDEIHSFVKDHIEGITPRDIRDAISGYGIEPKRQQSEQAKQLARIRSELKKLSAQEDIAAGKRLSPRDKTRQAQLLKQEAEIQRRLIERDFSPTPKREPPKYTRETYQLQKRLDEVKAQYANELYKATRGRGGRIMDELAKVGNIPKTVKSMGDISAVFRQGGFFALTHPITGGVKPFREMVKSFSDMGYRNVEQAIKSDPAFETLKKAGVEFTGVDKTDPKLSHHEEGYLGGEYLDYVPVAKQVKDFSERTFVSFLDAQRLFRGKQMLDAMAPEQRKNPAELKAIARLINSATGRGNLGRRGNQIAPVLNLAMFSPRLLKSRVELLNNMVNPVTIAKMPAGSRKQMIRDNVKFVGATVALLSLAKAAGAKVNTDPDDGDFLKIRVGTTTYDTLTGMQQPFRYVINMGRAVKADITGDETYSGQSKADLTTRFIRSKEAPLAGTVNSYLAGSDFGGRKFSLKNEAKDLLTPLPAKDVVEAFQQEGLLGAIKATPTFVGIGVNNYPEPADKATTPAEKLARKFVSNKLPDEARDDEALDVDRKKADLRARSRRGENVQGELQALGSKITERQAKGILSARNKTRLQEDFNRLGVKEAALVFSVATPAQQDELKPMMMKKVPLYFTLPPNQQESVKQKLNSLGIQIGQAVRPSREQRQ